MKKFHLPLLLLVGLAIHPITALADHDDDERRFWSNGNDMDWRLGSSGRERGHEIYYRYPGERRWIRAPGSAFDVGDGWVIGTDRRNGGFGIYRWSGNDWQRMPGAAVEIGGSYRNPWVVNDRGERFAWTGHDWREERNYRSRNDRRRDDRDERWNRDDNSWNDGRGRGRNR
jgi:hypothetical protein